MTGACEGCGTYPEWVYTCCEGPMLDFCHDCAVKHLIRAHGLSEDEARTKVEGAVHA